MKLSFSLSSKHASGAGIRASQNLNEENLVEDNGNSPPIEYITEFGPSQTSKYIIPPLKNQWNPEKIRNVDCALRNMALSTDPEHSFRVETRSLTGDAADSAGDGGGIIIDDVRNSSDGADNIDANESPGVQDILLQKLRDDLSKLPEETGFEYYADVPVEGFGAALLAGYGWSEGKGIGRTARRDVKVYEFKNRAAMGRKGLGFVADEPVSNLWDRKTAG